MLFSTLGGLIVKYNLADASKANRSIVRGHAAGAKEKVLPHILLQVKTGAFDRKKDYIPQVWFTGGILSLFVALNSSSSVTAALMSLLGGFRIIANMFQSSFTHSKHKSD